MGGKASMWNLWHGCHKWSEGCRHCYVYRTDGKYGKDSTVVTKTEKFGLPLQKKKNGEYKIPSGNLVYTCFTSDFLIEDADEWRAEAWEMMRIRQDLHFMFITKPIDRLQSVPATGLGRWIRQCDNLLYNGESGQSRLSLTYL